MARLLPLSGGDSPYPPLPRFPKNPFFRIRQALKKMGRLPKKKGVGSLPLPVLTRLLKAVILDFFFVCRGKFLTFLHKFLLEFPQVSL